MDLHDVRWVYDIRLVGLQLIYVAADKRRQKTPVNTVMNFMVPQNAKNFLITLGTIGCHEGLCSMD
jgi:hypothetical protein